MSEIDDIERNGFVSEEERFAPSGGIGAADLAENVAEYIEENELLHEGDSVLVGLSGGADSVALLTMLARLAPGRGWTVRAAHFNHGIRGIGAEEDELFCGDLCDAMGVVF